MRGYCRILLAVFLAVSLEGFAGTNFKATTTLTAQTSNNTSAADTFVTQTNGNLGATNISKVPTRSLLYAGSTAKIYAHFMPWFGFGGHTNVGYTSNDATQVEKQVTDMVSRGVDGAIVDWYGPGTFTHTFSYYDQATQELMHDAESNGNFSFAIMDDAGSLKACAGIAGCDVTQTLINDLTYAYNTYENSTAYLRYNNRPVVYFFGQEAYTLDWTRIRASVPGNPMFIFRNSGGFTYAQSNGAFSWVAPETVTAADPLALLYLDYFDKTALSLTSYSIESAYKGFNDSLASWGTHRLIQQQCGQTWLTSMAESGKFFSVAKQMLGIQLVTWNDYEEGTEIESGIDNCVTVSASASGTVVNWSITGQANTVDHYTVYLSQDGEKLMWLTDLPTSTSSLDLTQFQLNSGNYIVYVQAVGKPSLTNKMSAGVSLTVPNKPPVAVLSVTPNSGTAPFTVTASAAGSSDPDGSIVATTINFGDGSATVTSTTATHVYNSRGNYVVTATVTDNLGASSSTTATVAVAAANQPPVAILSVSPSNGYGPLTVTASTVASYDPDGSVAKSMIDFGDGTQATGATVSHTYSTAGVYTVTATVTDNSGASSSTSTSVTAKAPEVVVASPASGASISSPVHVTATGFSGFPVVSMQIYLDGKLNFTVGLANLDTNVNIAPGAHSLAVKGWDSSGRSFMTSLNITIVNQPPTAVLSVSSGSILVGGSITASTAGSSDPNGSIAATQIDFGDGTIVNAASASHQYTTGGTFTVKATVTDNQGASSTASATAVVKPQFVTITSPTAGTVPTSTVQVSGTANSGYAVVSTQVYLDGVLKYQVSGSSVSTQLTLSAGTHLICVQGWDASGATFKAFVTVTR